MDGSAGKKAQRDDIRSKVKACGADFQLVYIQADAEVRQQRVMERNRVRGETFSLEVPPAMFEHMERVFESPDKEELANAIVINSEAGLQNN